MKIYTETDGIDFAFWSGANQTIQVLTAGEIGEITQMLEDCFPNGMSETEFNDFFWFDTDTIAEWLGWPDYETLYDARTNGKWFDDYDTYNKCVDA